MLKITGPYREVCLAFSRYLEDYFHMDNDGVVACYKAQESKDINDSKANKDMTWMIKSTLECILMDEDGFYFGEEE